MSAPQVPHSVLFTILFALFLTSVATDSYSSDTADEALNAARKDRAEFFAEAYLQRGRADVERGDYLRAIRVLSVAINKGAVPEAFKWRGQAYDIAGNYEKALQDLGQYIGYNPSDPVGYVLRGDAHTFRRHFENALEDYNKAIDLDSFSVDALMGRGLAYLGLERHEEAIKDFQRVLRAEPRNPEALQNAGIAYMLSQHPAKALAFFRKASELETIPKWKEKLETWTTMAQQDTRGQNADRGPSNDDVLLALAEESGLDEAKSPKSPASTEIESNKSVEDEHTGERGGHGRAFERPIDRLMATRKPSDGGPAAASGSGWSSQKSVKGDWDATYLGHRVRLSVLQQMGKRVSGVLRISMAGGGEETYYFTGTFDQGYINVSHRDGNTFRGTLGTDGRLSGVLRMRNGQEISVNLAQH
ncbi:MAG: tetratricopeptide repeat protein [Desulfomonilaceae bacterium]